MAGVADEDERDRAIRRYSQLEERFVALGGYGAKAETEAASAPAKRPSGY